MYIVKWKHLALLRSKGENYLRFEMKYKFNKICMDSFILLHALHCKVNCSDIFMVWVASQANKVVT